MSLDLKKYTGDFSGNIKISGSKSESNRLLLLQAMFPSLKIKNLSDSDDTRVLQKALNSNATEIDIHHAGTAMRFLTAYFAAQLNKNVLLTGSMRMQERPVKILVDALRDLGADIDYINETGFPPLRISGRELGIRKNNDLSGRAQSRPISKQKISDEGKSEVSLKANISSQYISALALISPTLTNGLRINLEGKLTSSPYLKMTSDLLQELGAEVNFDHSLIEVRHLDHPKTENFTVESDWSSASYFFSLVALSEKSELKLTSFKRKSLQGDAAMLFYFEKLGVTTQFSDYQILLRKKQNFQYPETFRADLSKTPDLAQTIAVTCFGLNIPCNLTGLHTLKIKETDRLVALKNELEKLGARVEITENSLSLKPAEFINSGRLIKTYNDHRMAMAFAPLVLKTDLSIENPEVVSKSYPRFWDDLSEIGVI